MARTGTGITMTLAMLAALWAGPATASLEDDEAIKGTALDYAESWHLGDEERMARALHPEVLKRRVVTDLLNGEQAVQALDAPTLIRATREGVGVGGAGGPLSFRVAILDRHGDMAVVRVVSPLYVDYLQLVRWEGRWVILSIVWGPIDAAD
jgi:hypothetical protein